MDTQNAHRLTDKEHGTPNVALTSYAAEIDDQTEARAIRDLAEAIIASEVYIHRPA